MKLDSSLGREIKEKLLSGEELSESFVASVIDHKLHSLEIKHYGMAMKLF